MTAYWKTLSHNGVHFPPKYEPVGLSLKVRGKPVGLSPLAEEMAYMFAKKKDTPYVQDPVFTTNFTKDFVLQLPPWCRGAKFGDIDFMEFYRKVDQEKAAKEALTKEQKKALAASRKEQREALKARFGKAVLDGKDVDIANWMVEPPGLFMGRGKHPFRGKWKPRVEATDVILNLGESARVPPGSWKEVVHDHDSMWMAKWVDKLTDKERYVWLHESTSIQQSRSKAKYDNARKVGTNLERIRAKIMRELDSKDDKMRQVATVCYLIDTMGMRVGDEKDEDEADTVGASTLRVEHVRLKGESAEFDFLGKDSVSGESMLFYRIDGALYYSTIEQMAVNVTYRRVQRGSSGRLVGIPNCLVEVLTADSLNQKLAKVDWGKVNAIISHEITRPIFEIKTAGGRNIRVSGDHSLFRHASKGSYVAEAAPVCLLTERDSLATISSYPTGQPDLIKVGSIPITDDLLTFSGLWVADGCNYTKGIIISAGGDVSVNRFIERFSISFRRVVRDEIQSKLNAPLGLLPQSGYRRGRAATVLALLDERGTAFSHHMNAKGDIWCHSTALKDIMESLGFKGDSATKRIPVWLFTASDCQIALFLRGYFSGDGGLDRRLPTAVLASSISLPLLEEIRALLLRIGIDCTISEDTSYSGYSRSTLQWALSIKRKESVQRFMSVVQFLGERGEEEIKLAPTRYKRYPIAWRKIRRIAPVASHGKVYDLEVEGTQRFVVNGFLAHNSVAWSKSEKVPPSVARNLREFMSGKGKDQEIFHDVTSGMVNQFLSSIVPGVTAKVFRTHHATARAKEVLGAKDMKSAEELDKLYHAKEANLQAAIFCNHQRTPPKTWEGSLRKRQEKLQAAKAKGDSKRIAKLRREVDFYIQTKNYNLNTSMKNYIDPRVYKSWCDYVGLDWAKVYSKSLQRKFSWVLQSSPKWEQQADALKAAPATRRPAEHTP